MVDVEAAVDLDAPTVVGADLVFRDGLGEPEAEGDIAVRESILDFAELGFGIGLLGRVLGAGEQVDGFDGA